MNKKYVAAAGIGIILGATVWFNTGKEVEEVPVEKAVDLCAKACEPHTESKLVPTGEEIDGKQYVECFCKTEDRGWKRNRTHRKLIK